MSGAEGQDPAGTDSLDLQLPRGATSSGTPQTSTPLVTRLIDTKSLLQVTPYHGNKASFLGWKWSLLIAVRAISKPPYEGLKKIEDNMNRDFRKSRLSIGGTNSSECNTPLESVAGTNIHVTRSKNQYSTKEQKC